MADETGLKWWLRYIVVPLLGGGSLLVIILTQVVPHQKATSSQPTSSEPYSPTIVCTFVANHFTGMGTEMFDITPNNGAQLQRFSLIPPQEQVEETILLKANKTYTMSLEVRVWPGSDLTEKPFDYKGSDQVLATVPCRYLIDIQAGQPFFKRLRN